MYVNHSTLQGKQKTVNSVDNSTASSKAIAGSLVCMLVRDRFLQSCPTLFRPHGLQPTRLLHPWDFPGKNTVMGCHFFLQGIFPTQGLNSGLLHCRQILYCLSHWRSPLEALGNSKRECIFFFLATTNYFLTVKCNMQVCLPNGSMVNFHHVRK